MGELLLAAFALMMICEGVMPFVAPRMWRETMRRLAELSDGQLRFFGLSVMLAGLTALYFVT